MLPVRRRLHWIVYVHVDRSRLGTYIEYVLGWLHLFATSGTWDRCRGDANH